jgi:UDP-4-amino-4,6-dideoxy-N-acetyl-beta-L-altrosamine N-acetyltransferase
MLQIEKYHLKDLEEKELEVVLKWRNSEHIRKYMYSDHIISTKDHFKWYKSLNKDDSKFVKLLVCEGKPIGVVNFTDIDKRNSICYWGFYIGEKNSPPRSGTIMGLLALEYIFEKVAIRKLCAEVLGFNSTSINYHKKLGFVEEGCFGKHVFKNGEYMDVFLFALFKDKWLEIKQKLIEG